MALLWVNLLLLLLSLLQAPAYKLSALQLSGQDDTVRERLPADGGAQPGSRGQSAWDAAGSTSDFPVFLRGKREADEGPSNHSAEGTIAITGHPDTFSTTALSQAWEETEYSQSPDLLDESTSPENIYDDVATTAEPGSPATSNNVSTKAAGVPAGSRPATSAKAAPTPGASSLSSEAAVAGTAGTLPGGTESWENGSSTRPVGVKELEEISPTSPPEPPRESSGVSTVPPRAEPATSRPGLVMVAGSSVTAKAPPQKSPTHTSILVGKCLLAVFILALVAGVFIVCTAVLATLLWRQKRACQAHRRSNTEMVCISALLPDSEPVANGGQPSKIKRMKMPMDNGSETEGDNLTLSSFLPDH